MANLDKMRRLWLHVNNAPNNLLDKTKWMDVNTGGSTRDLPPIETRFIAKEPCSIENPHIILESFRTIIGYNYCYVDDYERYYWIVDYILLPQGAVELVLKEDVLMSFRDAIKEQVVHETRATNGQSNFLIDDKVSVQTNTKISKVYNIPFPAITEKPCGNQYLIKVINNHGITPLASDTGIGIARYAAAMFDLYVQYRVNKSESAKLWNFDTINKEPNEIEPIGSIHYTMASKRTDCIKYGNDGYNGYPFPYLRYDTHKYGFYYDKAKQKCHGFSDTGASIEGYDIINEHDFVVNGVTHNASNLNIVDSTFIGNIADKPTWINSNYSWYAFDCSMFAWRCCRFGYKTVSSGNAVSLDILSNDGGDGSDINVGTSGNTGSQLKFLLNNGCEILANSAEDLLPGDLVYWGPTNSKEARYILEKRQWQTTEGGQPVVKTQWFLSNDRDKPLASTLLEEIGVKHVQVYMGDNTLIGAESEDQWWEDIIGDTYNREMSGEGLCARTVPDFEAYEKYSGIKKLGSHLAKFVRPSNLVQ